MTVADMTEVLRSSAIAVIPRDLQDYQLGTSMADFLFIVTSNS